MESHLNVVDHIIKQERKDSETLHERLWHDQVERFTTAVNITEDMPSTSKVQVISMTRGHQTHLFVWVEHWLSPELDLPSLLIK